MAQYPAILNPTAEDVQKLLAAQAHIGTRNLNFQMQSYMWKRRNDGIYIIDLNKTWQKLQLAARVIAAVENPAEVCVVSARPWGQRAILKYAKYTGATAIEGRFVPGTFTNPKMRRAGDSGFVARPEKEPRLLVLTDPKTDHQPIREASYVNIPTIAFTHSDSPINNVDIAIPCNNKSKHSIGLMWWLLCREVLRYRNPTQYPRSQNWNIMVDLFFYRDPEENIEDAGEEGADNYDDVATQGADEEQDSNTEWEKQNWKNQQPGEKNWGDAEDQDTEQLQAWNTDKEANNL